MDYIWLKALHVASVLIFVSGLAIQTVAVAGLRDVTGPTLLTIERWDRQVTTPAMLSTWLFGALIAVKGEFFTSGWLIAKLGIVVALSGLHGMQAGRLRHPMNSQSTTIHAASSRTLFLVLIGVAMIAILAVSKPRF